ncbi:MAG: porin family protein [Bacteroidales bacterium]
MKYLLSIYLFFLFTLSLFSQDSKFNIGIEAGPNYTLLKMSTFDFDHDYYHPIIRYSAGLSLNYKLSNLFSVGTGIAFEQKAAITDYYHTDMATAFPPFTYNEWRTIDRFNYLTLPVLLKTCFGKKIVFFLNTGCFVSYILNSKSIIESKYFPEVSYDHTNYTERFDYGIITGLGVSIPVKNSFSISFEARNNLGIHDLINDEGWSYDQILKTNSTNFLIGLQYRFKSRKKDTK